MGLLDSVIGNVLGGGAAASPMGNILSSILGGGQGGGLAGGLLGGLANSGQGGGVGGGSLGGLGGLLQQFQRGGLGDVAQSWVGSGPNQPVSPDQLRNVFGHQQVNQWANQAGMEQGDFLSQLSQHLPRAVDSMTPDGRLPDEGSMSV